MLFSRLALIATVATAAAGAGAATAAPVYAAVNPPALGPVTSLSPESAMLTGAVDTGDIAPGTNFIFIYDTRRDFVANGGNFSQNAQYAPAVPDYVPASTGLVSVSELAGCYPLAFCRARYLTPLAPGTTYVYQLQSKPGGTSAGPYYDASLLSPVSQFTTPSVGKLAVAEPIRASRGWATVSLTDKSVMSAKGTVTLSAKVGRKTLASKAVKFTILPRATVLVRVKLPKLVLARLGLSRRLAGTARITDTTDQAAGSQKVTLTA